MLLNREGINSLQRGVLVVLLDRKGSTLYQVQPGHTSNPRSGHASGVQAWAGVQRSPYEASSGATASQDHAVLLDH